MKLSHAGLMMFANPMLLGKSEGVTGVGSSALLGIWSQILIILLATIAAFVISDLGSCLAKIRMGLNVLKLAGCSPAKWTSICWIRDWVKIAKLTPKLFNLYLERGYLRFKLHILARQKRKLLIHQVNHVLGQTSRAGNSDNLFCGVGCTHNICGVKMPNEKS
jgi:hypothetical protein